MMMQMMGGGNSGEAVDEEMKGPSCPVMGLENKGHGAGGGACPFISSSKCH